MRHSSSWPTCGLFSLRLCGPLKCLCSVTFLYSIVFLRFLRPYSPQGKAVKGNRAPSGAVTHTHVEFQSSGSSKPRKVARRLPGVGEKLI